jgi:hypothetical protein
MIAMLEPRIVATSVKRLLDAGRLRVAADDAAAAARPSVSELERPTRESAKQIGDADARRVRCGSRARGPRSMPDRPGRRQSARAGVYSRSAWGSHFWIRSIRCSSLG